MKVIKITYKLGIEKPRVPFCHECSKKLRGNHHAIVNFKNINHDFVYHVDCAKNLKIGR